MCVLKKCSCRGWSCNYWNKVLEGGVNFVNTAKHGDCTALPENITKHRKTKQWLTITQTCGQNKEMQPCVQNRAQVSRRSSQVQKGGCSPVSKPKQQCFCSANISHKKEFWSPVKRCVPFNTLFKYSRMYLEYWNKDKTGLNICWQSPADLFFGITPLSHRAQINQKMKSFLFFLSCYIINNFHYVVYKALCLTGELSPFHYVALLTQVFVSSSINHFTADRKRKLEKFPLK